MWVKKSPRLINKWIHHQIRTKSRMNQNCLIFNNILNKLNWKIQNMQYWLEILYKNIYFSVIGLTKVKGKKIWYFILIINVWAFCWIFWILRIQSLNKSNKYWGSWMLVPYKSNLISYLQSIVIMMMFNFWFTKIRYLWIIIWKIKKKLLIKKHLKNKKIRSFLPLWRHH